MKRLVGIALVLAMSVSLMTGCTPDQVETIESTEVKSVLSSRPQDDYYYYVNKDRLDNAVFEYGANSAAYALDSSLVNDQIKGIIKEVVAGSGYEKGSEEYIIQSFYNAYLAYDFANEPIPENIVNAINDVINVKSVDEMMMLDARLFRDYGVGGFLSMSVVENSQNPSENILSFAQLSGIAGASFDSIRDDNYALNSIVTDIKTYMQTLDYDADTASGYGRELANIVLKIYGSTDLELMDSEHNEKFEQIISAEEFHKIFTNVDTSEYLKEIGYDEHYCKYFSIYDKGQLECMNSILVNENLNALKAWKIYNIYSTYMKYIAPHYTLLSGYVETSYDTPEEDAVNLIMLMLESETDPIYVERYYTKETDDALRSMCDDIKEGYRNLISNATWLTEPTRKGLLEKLDNIVYVTATDVKRHDTSKYAGMNGNFYELFDQYQRIQFSDGIEKLTKPADRYELLMTMQTVNACYMATTNTITITSAIMTVSSFNADADYYTNLGKLGATIAHEMGHAFDSNCIVYDKNGVYNPSWIADEDMEALNERNKEAAAYFEDNFTVFGIYHVDGERTLGENYADLSGMEVITSLAKTDEDLKKIFESYAEFWCKKCVDQSVMYSLTRDVHSPNVIRVNAICSTLDCFYDVYDVKEGDGMYIAPEKRISRWY